VEGPSSGLDGRKLREKEKGGGAGVIGSSNTAPTCLEGDMYSFASA